MEFITVNHSLNQTYHVEYKAIEQTVKKAVTKLRGYKLENLEIKSSTILNNINIFIEVTFPKNISYTKGTSVITEKIDEYISNLIDAKPKNIQIKINK